MLVHEKSMDKQEFARQLSELQNQIFYAILSHDIYLELWPSDDKVHIINYHKDFFNPVRSALYQAMFMGLSRIFDLDNRTISLVSLLDSAVNQAELVPNLTSKELEDIIAQILKHSDILRTMRQLRDQQLAHSDANLQPLSPLTLGEISDLIETVMKVFNELSIGHDRAQYAWEFQRSHSKQDAAEVIRILQEEVKKPRQY